MQYMLLANYYLSKFQNKFNPKHTGPPGFCVRDCAPLLGQQTAAKPDTEMGGDPVETT